MDHRRYDNSKDRIRVQMDLRPPTSENGSPAPWIILIDLELSRSHIAYIMDNGLFLQHPTRYIVPCDRVNTPKREWEIREFPDKDPAVSRWSGRITLFTFGQDARQKLPGLEVLHQSMIHSVFIWSRPNEEMMFEYNQAAKVNYNNINDDEPHQCLRRFWTGDQSTNMSDLAAVRYRGGGENGRTTGALVTRRNKGESAVGRVTRREHTGYQRNEYRAWPAHPRGGVEVPRAQGSVWENLFTWMDRGDPDRTLELVSFLAVPLVLSLSVSVMILAGGVADRIARH
ncbi:hypothetical protein V8F06_014501 [Rhypophila decipiens]